MVKSGMWPLKGLTDHPDPTERSSRPNQQTCSDGSDS